MLTKEMSEVSGELGESPAKRDRSPPFPYIGLGKAVDRTAALLKSAKRYDIRVSDAAPLWGMRPTSSSALQTIGALLAFGLVEASGSGENRKLRVSDSGHRILEDGRPGIRQNLLAVAATKPKLIARYAQEWQDGRPDDAHCLSTLRFDGGFTDEAAKAFLRVFDETMRFASPASDDKMADLVADVEEAVGDDTSPLFGVPETPAQPPSASQVAKVGIMAGERELTTGLLSKGGASFRLIVSGTIGEKEIERLIRKLQLDKEILADDEQTESEDENAS